MLLQGTLETGKHLIYILSRLNGLNCGSFHTVFTQKASMETLLKIQGFFSHANLTTNKISSFLTARFARLHTDTNRQIYFRFKTKPNSDKTGICYISTFYIQWYKSSYRLCFTGDNIRCDVDETLANMQLTALPFQIQSIVHLHGLIIDRLHWQISVHFEITISKDQVNSILKYLLHIWFISCNTLHYILHSERFYL